MLTEVVTEIAVKILDTTDYAGAWFLMTLESMVAPVPSEAVMPFVGFQVADGKWNFWFAAIATSLGSITGSLLSYWMGYAGGKPVVLKFGKYLLLNVHDLEMTERYFHRRQGLMTVFVARFIPVIRHFISIPAGIGKMPLWPFLWVTFLGSTCWNLFLLACGMKLREHWAIILTYSHQIDLVIVALALIVLAWFYRARTRMRQGIRNPS